MNFIQRELGLEILAMANQYPVVTLIGPRQSGKTTLIKQIFPVKPYISLENPDERSFALSDPRAFLERYPQGAILDEIQRVPQLLSYIQGIVDERNIAGMFLLTGSHQLALHEAVSQSLAGRTALLKLMPFSIKELLNAGVNLSLDDYLFHGFYPRVHKNNLNPTKFYRDYVQTYVERDVRQMIHVRDLTVFQHFLKLCAGRIGQIFNSQGLANELGVSHSTIKNWLSVLEASFLIFRLAPYFENFGKRVIKSPKLYFNDVGLACYLLDITSSQQLIRDPLRGHLVENLVVSELVKTQLNQGLEPSLYFYRDSNQNEVDVLYKTGAQLIPIEIKSAKTFNNEFLKGLRYFKNIAQQRCPTGIVIYAGTQEQDIDIFRVLNFKNSAAALATEFKD